MTGALPQNGTQPATTGGSDWITEVTVDRAGPGGGVPSDSAFGVALVTLWQRVAEAGAQVGFPVPVVRSEVAGRAAGLVEEIRTGRIVAVVANRSHRLIGAALLRPGRGDQEHTGRIEVILVDPASTRTGLGSRLLTELLGNARARGIERWEIDAAADAELDPFFTGFGFVEWGRRPGWVRTAEGDRDEICWGMTL